MTDRAIVVLRTQTDRDKAARWAQGVAVGSKVVFLGPSRSLPQNDLFWSCMRDISRQHQYHSLTLSPEDWRTLFMDALNREGRLVPNLSDDGFVSLGRSSSALSKEEFSGLLETVFEWGSRNGIVWSDQK